MWRLQRLLIALTLCVATVLNAGTAVTWNNSPYVIPAAGEINWQALSAFLVDLGQNAATTNLQKFGARVATTTPVTVGATDAVVISNMAVASAVTVNLPAGVTGRTVWIVDGKGDAGANAITLDANGAQTINGALTYELRRDREAVQLVFQGTNWTVVASHLDPDESDATTISPTTIDSKSVPQFEIFNADTTVGAGSAFVMRTRGSNQGIAGMYSSTQGSQTSNLCMFTENGGSIADQFCITPGGTPSFTVPLPSTSGGSGVSSTATFPTSGVIVTEAATETLTNKTLTAPVIATIVNTGTLTLPTSTDTLVGKATTDTLTNKTLTAPVIATISNTGTLTLPTSTDTLVGKATTDVFTNKSFNANGTGNVLTNVEDADLNGAINLTHAGLGITSGTSGGIPYFTASSTALTSSAALASGGIVVGGGAGVAPSTSAAVSTSQNINTTGNIGAGGTADTFLHAVATDSDVISVSNIDSKTVPVLEAQNLSTTSGSGVAMVLRTNDSSQAISGVYSSTSGSGTSDLNLFTENSNTVKVKETWAANGTRSVPDPTNGANQFTSNYFHFCFNTSATSGAVDFLTLPSGIGSNGEFTIGTVDGSTNITYQAKVYFGCDGTDCDSAVEEKLNPADAITACSATVCTVTPGSTGRNLWCVTGYADNATPTAIYGVNAVD